MFVAKALEYTLRHVVLLTVNRSVLLQNTVDDIREGASFGRFGGWRRRYPGGSECRSIFLTVSRAMPNRLAASRWLRPSTWQASRTRRYGSTVYILPPSIAKKIEGYRWQSFTPPAAGKSRRFRGLICHRRSHPYVVFRPNRTVWDHPRITASNRHPRSPVFQFRTAHFSSKQLFPSSGSRHRCPVTFLLDRQRPDDARHLVRQCDGD